MSDEDRFRAILSEALAKFEAMGLHGVVMASVSYKDREGFCSGEVCQDIGPAAQVVHLGFIHATAYEEMAALHPSALLEATKEVGRA